jgi:hypothetical protein
MTKTTIIRINGEKLTVPPILGRRKRSLLSQFVFKMCLKVLIRVLSKRKKEKPYKMEKQSNHLCL